MMRFRLNHILVYHYLAWWSVREQRVDVGRFYFLQHVDAVAAKCDKQIFASEVGARDLIELRAAWH